ncbi:MAG TPA: MBL fold metallo-hydrolase [Candidatus Binatia bacterium]|jgi:glyoxylase-like metal-dependent hydrolase (beta-lactamase superfamily II)/rhodanese-related sulfurtransferase
MLFRELNHGKCKTYLIACENTRKAALIDPVREKIDRYLAILAYYGCRLDAVIDTHSHADHRTASFDLCGLTGAKVIMHRRAPAPHVEIHVDDGQRHRIGDIELQVLYTPGHTPDSMSVFTEGRVFTGDTLLIRGTGRSDFAGGDSGEQFDSITQKLFRLPDETLVFPAHDYRGNSHSTIGEEKRFNPRISGRTREEYIALMNNLGLPLPDKIQEVLQPNQSALEDDRIAFPTLAKLSQVRQMTPKEVQGLLGAAAPPFLVDVREPEEYDGELGHIPGSVLMPLKDLSARAAELEPSKERHVIVVCRAGVRSTTAAAILVGLGFEHVSNLKGGMLEWNDQNLPVERVEQTP